MLQLCSDQPPDPPPDLPTDSPAPDPQPYPPPGPPHDPPPETTVRPAARSNTICEDAGVLGRKSLTMNFQQLGNSW
eukprot:941419-Pleurochrysis_carterae.AAC.3